MSEPIEDASVALELFDRLSKIETPTTRTEALDLFTACMQAARGDNYKRIRPGTALALDCPACGEKIEVDVSALER